MAAAADVSARRCGRHADCCCRPTQARNALSLPARLPQKAPTLHVSSSRLSLLAAAPPQHRLVFSCWRRRRSAAAAVVAAAAPAPAADSAPLDDEAAAEDTEDEEDDPEQQMARLPRPSTQHQPKLSGKERAALRSQAESLAKAKTLQRVQVGARGVTLNVLVTIADALAKHEFVRVKLGEGCGLERKHTAEQLGQLLDAAVVGQVGFTITLYRQKGLPRPDSLTKPQQEQQQQQE